MMSSIVLFIINQGALLLAFFLPLKVIIMLGSPAIPKSLRFLIDESNREDFIIILAVLSVVFYIVYFSTELLLKRLAMSVAQKIESRLSKLSQFRQHNLFVEDVVIRVIRTFSSFALAILGLLCIAIIEVQVFFALILSVSMQLLMFSVWLRRTQDPTGSQLFARIVGKKTIWLNFFSSFNFFVGFAACVYSFLFGAGINLLLGILVILLVRQVFQRIVATVNDGFFLVQHRSKIEATLYKNAVYERELDSPASESQGLLNSETRLQFLKEVLDKEKLSISPESFIWVDSGQKDIYQFKAKDTLGDLWIKVYEETRISMFQLEKVVFTSALAGITTLELKSSGTFKGLNYTIATSPSLRPMLSSESKPFINDYKVHSWSIEPNDELVRFIQLNFPSMTSRVSRRRYEKLLSGALDKSEIELIETFLSILSDVKRLMSSMPIYLRNLHVNYFNLMLSEDQKPFIISWQRCALEPVGSDLKYEQLQKFKGLDDVLDEVKSKRTDATNVTESDMVSILLISSIDKCLQKQLFAGAVFYVKTFLAHHEQTSTQQVD